MIARIQGAVTVGLVVLAVLSSLMISQEGYQVAAVLLLLGLFTGHAIVLGIEFLAMRAINRNDSAPSAPPGSTFKAWAAEVVHGPLVFCWRQPFRSQRFADSLRSGSRRGVLLVHGFVCNRGLWNRWILRLKEGDVAVIAVNLEPVFGSIDDYRDIIDHGVSQLQAATGLPPIVVAHSMGGLAVRRWWSETRNGTRIHHLITLGTPHHGTWLARFAMSPNAGQMRLGSRWLQRLQEQETPDRRRRTSCFYSHTDNIVFPASSGTLAGAENRLLTGGVAHVAMVDDPRPWEYLQEQLRLH
jgi:pimeloyl-ACP methyl ester carboxylesterase